ncbi:alpha-amylase family protein [Negadavirga shengliensis]|uniref:Alpha-amylase family protein n=1 Tax=Negadavirga shengliensis TaxID=1389218 RepID=A0ABV9T7I0_9BACT
MKRRDFIKAGSLIGSAAYMGNAHSFISASTRNDLQEMPWFNRAMRWAQLAFVESDPGNYDPDFWLDYFKRIHADGVLLSAGGVVAFYPTAIPLHHRSNWLGEEDTLGYLVSRCRRMGMTVILRTDPHAARQEVYDAHPDWIAVTGDGEKRRHWANPDLWVTCALGPYNFDFMTEIHEEIMQRYEPEAIFSNRWAGHGTCYCIHCQKHFKAFSGLDLPQKEDRLDPVYQKYNEWRIDRLRELWFLWDETIRHRKPTARYIPNGFPDKLITGKHSDFFFADQQARRGVIPPWSNGKHAKELRATMGMKTQVGIFSVGLEEQYRWKDSVQSDAEIRLWVAEGTANGILPCFVKFGGVIFDKRWMDGVANIYQTYHSQEKYLRNTRPLARVGVVYSEQTNRKYGGQPWQQQIQDHGYGMYHALVEDRMPFEMVNDLLLDEEHLHPFKLLILPNIAALSDAQCEQLKKFVEKGGSLLATFETSLYDEEGQPRGEFGLSELLGVNYAGKVEGPMQNSYLRLKSDPDNRRFHPVLEGLEDAYRIINTIYRVEVNPKDRFPSPVTLIPTYPDLPMEDVYPRVPDSDVRELYLKEVGKGRVAYFPGDMDRSFWQIMNVDHGNLLRNTIRWALNETPVIEVEGAGILDTTVWRQQASMTVHLVNLTNPMMMKGPCREIIPLSEQRVTIQLPGGTEIAGLQLLMSGEKPEYTVKDGRVKLTVPKILDHEIIAVDFRV